MRSFKHLFNNPLLMVSFPAPPFHLEQPAASVTATASYLNPTRLQKQQKMVGLSNVFHPCLIWLFPLFVLRSPAVILL